MTLAYKTYRTFDEALQAAERAYRETGEDYVIDPVALVLPWSQDALQRPWTLTPFPRPVQADG